MLPILLPRARFHVQISVSPSPKNARGGCGHAVCARPPLGELTHPRSKNASRARRLEALHTAGGVRETAAVGFVPRSQAAKPPSLHIRPHTACHKTIRSSRSAGAFGRRPSKLFVCLASCFLPGSPTAAALFLPVLALFLVRKWPFLSCQSGPLGRPRDSTRGRPWAIQLLPISILVQSIQDTFDLNSSTQPDRSHKPEPHLITRTLRS